MAIELPDELIQLQRAADEAFAAIRAFGVEHGQHGPWTDEQQALRAGLWDAWRERIAERDAWKGPRGGGAPNASEAALKKAARYPEPTDG